MVRSSWLLVFVLLLPFVLGHAAPVAYSPQVGAKVFVLPSEVGIDFSERVEATVSDIIVIGPTGREVQGEVIWNEEDPRHYGVEFVSDGDGEYTVVWKLVSADDGHFSKGEYSFFLNTDVGAGLAQLQIQHLTPLPEVLLIFLDLLGMAVLVGAALGLIFGVGRARRLVYWGVGLVALSGVLWLLLKTFDLQQLRGLPFLETLLLFLGTSAGSFALVRIALALVFMFVSNGWVLISVLGLMLVMRSIVSHAAVSGPVAVGMTFLQLLGKEIWIGVLIVMIFGGVKEKVGKVLNKVINLGLVLLAVAGSFVIWVHLKDFSYLFTTPWGSRFAALALVAVVLLVLRVYSHFSGSGKWMLLELIIGLVVLCMSSYLVITSPPLGANEFGVLALVMIGNALLLGGLGFFMFRHAGNYKVRKNWAKSLGVALLIVLCVGILQDVALETKFQKLCEKRGHFWLESVPMWNGEVVGDRTQAGCTLDVGLYHFVDFDSYTKFLTPTETLTGLQVRPKVPLAGEDAEMIFSLQDFNREPVSDLTIEHERVMHVLILGEDLETFAHVHAEDSSNFSEAMVTEATLPVDFVFPVGGRYKVLADYVVKNQAVLQQFNVDVVGEEMSKGELHVPANFRRQVGMFDGYEVRFSSPRIRVGEEVRLKYVIVKDGEKVRDLEPYLGATMHFSVIRSDLSRFIHGHGEISPPGSAFFEQFAREYISFHSHFVPDRFGPRIEVPLTFEQEGVYKIFGEFSHEGKVIVSEFVLEVD